LPASLDGNDEPVEVDKRRRCHLPPAAFNLQSAALKFRRMGEQMALIFATFSPSDEC